MVKYNLNIIILIILLILYYYNETYYPSDNMTYEKSIFDNKMYLVRDLPDKKNSANMISKCKSNIIKLINYLNKNKKNFPKFENYITDSLDKVRNVVIMETSADKNNFKTTSYTINKKTVILCIRDKYMDKIHDENTLMYVLIHEMAHMLNPEIGHGENFKKIFKFLVEQSSIIGIYRIVDYSNNHINYCGMVIGENIFA
jgi:hypothetical protein